MSDREQIERLVIPPVKARDIVAQASRIHLRDCVCRVREQACPPDTWEVCLLFEHASEDDLRDARLITTETALSILETSAERGLVHQLFYWQTSLHLTELCNCCSCCCAPVRQLKQEGNYSDQLRSGYVAVTDTELGIDCGVCQDSCFFEARHVEDGVLRFVDERCFGCGCCVESCPEEAIRLEIQPGRGVPIPTAV